MAQPKTRSRGAGTPAEALGVPDIMEEIYGHPAHLVRRTYQIFISMFEEEVGELGLTPVQFIILVVLSAHPGIDQTTLAGLAAIDKTSCGRAVDLLSRRGLVSRSEGARDRRQKPLALTAAGQELLGKSIPGVRRLRERLLAPLSTDRQAAFMQSLQEFVTANNRFSRAPFRALAGADD